MIDRVDRRRLTILGVGAALAGLVGLGTVIFGEEASKEDERYKAERRIQTNTNALRRGIADPIEKAKLTAAIDRDWAVIAQSNNNR